MKRQYTKILKQHLWELLVIFFVLILMVAGSAYFGDRSVKNHISQLGEQTMNTVETAVAASLKQAELQFELLFDEVQFIISRGADKGEIITLLEYFRRVHLAPGSRMPEFMSTYGFFDGEVIFDDGWEPDYDYVPQNRPWYTGAIQNKEGVFLTEPYLDAHTGVMCISFSRRLVDSHGDFYGVFAMDLELSRITDHIDKASIDNQGYGVLISDNLHIIYHHDKSLIGISITDIGGYSRISELLVTGQIISVEQVEIDGHSSIAFFRTIFSGWHVGIIAPANIYNNQVLKMVIVLCVLGLILLGMLGYIFVKIMNEKVRSDEESIHKRLFVERVSHELRTPVNAILSLSDIAKNTEDNLKRVYCLDKIHDASHYLLGIITETLDMSKIEAGDLEINRTDFAVTELMNRVTAIFGYDIAQKHQELNINIGARVPQAIVSDMQLLTQVLTNLLGNAYKYTPSGGRIGMSVEVVGNDGEELTLRFSVTDNGAGIPQEEISQMLDPAAYSSAKLFGSAGLGLAISQHIVTKMGGEIWAESEPGEGSRFIFDLKVLKGKIADEVELRNVRAKTDEVVKVTKFPGKCILLAEDIEINREIVIELLRDTEVTIECAENGREAVAMFNEEPDKYDLIFMDIQMPEMDGYTATAKIREMGTVQARNIPIVAMTANVFKEDAEHCIKAGMNGHIGKPIHLNEVLLAMQEFIIL